MLSLLLNLLYLNLKPVNLCLVPFVLSLILSQCLLFSNLIVQSVPKNALLLFLGKNGLHFPKHGPGNFRKTACPKKHLALKSFTRKFRIYGQNSPNFCPKISPKIQFFYTSLAAKSSFINILLDFFATKFRMLTSFLNDVNIQLILEFKHILENIIQSFLKVLKWLFLGQPVVYISVFYEKFCTFLFHLIKVLRQKKFKLRTLQIKSKIIFFYNFSIFEIINIFI